MVSQKATKMSRHSNSVSPFQESLLLQTLISWSWLCACMCVMRSQTTHGFFIRKQAKWTLAGGGPMIAGSTSSGLPWVKQSLGGWTRLCTARPSCPRVSRSLHSTSQSSVSVVEPASYEYQVHSMVAPTGWVKVTFCVNPPPTCNNIM